MSSRQFLLATVFILSMLFAGCTMDRWVEVESGDYAPVQRRITAGQNIIGTIQNVKIDRNSQKATFIFSDGSEFIATFVPRDKSQWPTGCPANINSTRMEVLDITESSLIIGPITFTNPVLVRDCPGTPEEIVLREDGTIGGGGGACINVDKCIIFERQSPP